jgi:hypothetical protein
MIHAKELRVGNKVYGGDRIKTVDHIDANDDTFGFDEDADTFCLGMNEGYIRPIPLTTDILSKCGFEYNYFDGYTFQHPNGLSFTQPDITKINFRGAWIGCKYLHQLQNLFFALTGQDLTIKL